MKVCLIDGLPTYHVWTNTSKDWALNSWHWLFLAQPEPFPETLISAVPAEWFLTNRGGTGLGNLPKPVFDEYHPLLHAQDDQRHLPRLSRQRRVSISRWTPPTRTSRSRRPC